MDSYDDFLRTIGYGEAAVGHLKAHETPAYPRNYEIWYTYSAGYNQALNKALNELMRLQAKISSEDTDRIYEEFLAPHRFGDRMERIGGKLSGELRSVMTAIDSACENAHNYGETLEGASNQLQNSAQDAEALQKIVDGLVSETKDMAARNLDLEDKLLDSKRQIEDLRVSLETIRNETLTDPLTGLANRRCLDQSLARCIVDAQSTSMPMSVLISDIDHFKKFNDNYGHQTGDQVLRLVANAVKQNVKGQDVAARYGGEEFCILLPRTDLQAAIRVAEHIRQTVMGKELIKRSTGERLGRITISIGCAELKADDNAGSLIERADLAMYRAKNLGRNRVCSELDIAEDHRRRSAS